MNTENLDGALLNLYHGMRYQFSKFEAILLRTGTHINKNDMSDIYTDIASFATTAEQRFLVVMASDPTSLAVMDSPFANELALSPHGSNGGSDGGSDGGTSLADGSSLECHPGSSGGGSTALAGTVFGGDPLTTLVDFSCHQSSSGWCDFKLAYAAHIFAADLSTPGDPFAFLRLSHTAFLLDNSHSMTGQLWSEITEVLGAITPICTAANLADLR